MSVFNIHHVTKYEYDRPVKESVNEIRIYPVLDKEQELLSHEVIITGSPDVLLIYDYWNNRTGMFNLMPPHQELIIESKLIVRTLGTAKKTGSLPGDFDSLYNEVNNNLSFLDLCILDEPDLRNEILSIATEIKKPNAPVSAFVENCSDYIFKNFSYIKGITTVETTLSEILKLRSGVCQDFAHLMLGILRSLQIPSRYVSGYICPNKNGMRGEGATHAWIEAWIPGLGWTGIDPTNNTWVSDHHVKLAVGRNFNDCSPIKGTFKGPAKQSLSVYVSIGYEDGHKFEDITKVKLEKLAEDDDDTGLLASFAAQQQQ
ncbi:MAG: transglutaminase, N-terminal domain protein [Chitinophagaceae bacterium]|nr:transglutaminase, N-terminal domain protein [Chitinophagaceae bacterium]